MKCTTIERWILLGGQASRRKRRIDAHLEGCPACRQWLEDYRKISVLTEAALPSGEPSQKVLTTIQREARVRVGEPRARTNWIMPLLRPAYGLATVAALGLVLIGGWWLKPDPNGFGSEAQLSTILLMLTEETVDLDSDTAPAPADVEAMASLDALAERLLTLQGLDDTYTDAELSTPGEAHQATDPLTRSSAASRSERYG
ncbi:MAG: zf-HC2 domain-containing protein [Kiritimatiellae bacterium]|nr:zf-HC2 domain-containing protein [Kiritimatiellia bacterium]